MNRDPDDFYHRQDAWATLVTMGLVGLAALIALVIWLPWWVTAGAVAVWLVKNCVSVRIVRK